MSKSEEGSHMFRITNNIRYDVVADGYDEPGGIRVGGETVDEDFEIV